MVRHSYKLVSINRFLHLMISKKLSNKVIQSKLIDNLPDGGFYPEQLISRAELASILVKAFY